MENKEFAAFESHSPAWKNTMERYVYRMKKYVDGKEMGINMDEAIAIANQSLKMDYEIDSTIETEARIRDLMADMFTVEKESGTYDSEQTKAVASRASDCIEQVALEVKNEQSKQESQPEDTMEQQAA